MTRNQATPVAAILWTLGFALIVTGAWAFAGLTPVELMQATAESFRNTWGTLVSWIVATFDAAASLI